MDKHAILIIAVAALVTIAIRFIPFLFLGKGKKTPAFLTELSVLLPPAVMGMLVVYCLKGTSFNAPANWVPALVSAAVTVGLHLWRRKTLLSILGGTIVYILLANLIFV